MKTKQYGIRKGVQAGGLTFIDVLTVIVVVVGSFIMFGFLADFLFFGRAKAKAQRFTCMNNMSQLATAFHGWRDDHNGESPWANLTPERASNSQIESNLVQSFRAMSNYLRNPKLTVCPTDDRMQANDFERLHLTNISYFIGPDADETFPALWLWGDRNLTMNGVPVPSGLVTIGTNVTMGFSTTMHKGTGNVALNDGSMQSMSATKSAGGMRLVIP